MKIFIKSILFIFLVFTLHNSFAQTLNANWKTDLSSSLDEFIKCSGSNDDSNDCKVYTAKSLNVVYKVNDFYSEDQGRYLYVNEIAELLNNNDKWTLMGKCYDQKVLSEGQTLANSKKATIAVYRNEEGVGMHIALILPGELISSGTWGLQVPNTMSFFTNTPDKSFVGKGLSYAFSKSQIKDIVLYKRNY